MAIRVVSRVILHDVVDGAAKGREREETVEPAVRPLLR